MGYIAVRKDVGMWVFLTARLRAWLFLAVALPLARLLVHRLAVAAERRDASARAARLLHRADSAVTAVAGHTSARRSGRRTSPARWIHR
jgi:hypothetical protein